MRSRLKYDILFLSMWGMNSMKTKIIYISGNELFSMAEIRDAFEQVRNTLDLQDDTVLFAVPVDKDDAIPENQDIKITETVIVAPTEIITEPATEIIITEMNPKKSTMS